MQTTQTQLKPWAAMRVKLHEWQYIKVKIISDLDTLPTITEKTFRMSIQQALQSNFGLAGVSLIIDVLDWDESQGVGIIKMAQSEMVTVASALILHSFAVGQQQLAFDIIDSSASLLSLAGDSRTLGQQFKA